MKIANKISFSFFAIVFIITVTMGVTFYLIAREDLEKSIHDKLSAVLASRADHIELYLSMLKSSTVSTSKSVVLEVPLRLSGEDAPRMAKAVADATNLLKRKKKSDASVFEYMILNKAGRVIASTEETSVGRDKSGDSYFLGAQREVYVKDAYFSETEKEPFMAVSAPFLDSDTQAFLGVLVARVRLDYLNDIAADRTGLGDGGEIYIVNRYGYMITHSKDKKDVILKQKVDTPQARLIQLHKDKEHIEHREKIMSISPDYRGVLDLGTHEYIPQMRWGIIAEIEASEAFAPLTKIWLFFLGILFIVLIIAWLLSVSVARLITASLGRLRKGIEIVGRGDLDYRVDTGTKDEVGQLSRAFDTMTRYLKESTTSIESLNKEIVERKKAEAALRESEKKYRSLFEGSRDAIMTLEPPSWKFTAGNQAAIEMFKAKNKDEFVSCEPWKLSPERQPDGLASDEKAKEMIEKAMREGSHFFEWTHKRISGEEFPVTVLLSRVEQDENIFLQATVRDITERKKAEDAIAAAKDYTENIIKSMFDTLIVINPDGKIRSINKATAVLLDYKEEELIGKPFGTIVAEEEEEEEGIPFIGTRLKELIKEGFIKEYDMTYKTKSGEMIPVSFSGAVIRDKDGELIGIVCIGRDLRERKKAERALQIEKDNLKAIFASSPVGMLLLDEELMITDANNTAASIVLRDPAQIIQQRAGGGLSCIHSLENEKGCGFSLACPECPLRKAILQVLTAGTSIIGAEIQPTLMIDGREHRPWLRINAELIFLDGRKHVIVAIDDITESKKAEEELKESQEQLFQVSKMASLGQLSAGAAHEINNPLAGIVGFTEATLLDLKNQKITPDKIAHDLKIVLKNAERCKVIISNLLNFARAKELQRQESDINSLTDDALALVEYKTTAQNIKVVKRYENNPRKVNIDMDQMMQVFINVISNAQNAMPDGGELLVSTWSEDNFASIEFKDTGIGIEKENLIRVFDPFFTTREPGQGVGLGLSISYSIMKRHEGSIEAKSDGKNKGASFIIKIPT